MTRLALVLSLLPTLAFAAPPPVGSDDWNGMAPFRSWIAGQHDAIGRWCRDIGGGRPVEAVISAGNPVADEAPHTGPETQPMQSGRVIIEPRWWVHVTQAHFPDEPDRWMPVPDEKVTRNANPTGMPILWLYQGRVQCFAPPNGA